MSLNLYEAINAHVAWKVRLHKHIQGTSKERLDPSIIGRDDQCALGKWIQANIGTYEDLPLFRQVRERHADFHRCAAEIVESVDRGEMAEAQRKLHHDYAVLSHMIIKSITKLSKSLPEE